MLYLDSSNLLDDLGLCAGGWRDAYLRAVVADLEGGEVTDPMQLNDLAGVAILEGRHSDAAGYLREAAHHTVSIEAAKVLSDRAKEQELLADIQRMSQFPVIRHG